MVATTHTAIIASAQRSRSSSAGRKIPVKCNNVPVYDVRIPVYVGGELHSVVEFECCKECYNKHWQGAEIIHEYAETDQW